MATRVLVQAGHSAALPPFQAGGGGAPGEAAWVTDLARRIAARLTTRGVDVTLVGCWNLDNSNAPAAVTKQDYALALSLHYDAAVYGPGKNTGCFADRARGDPQGAAADRFIALWEPRYTQATGLALHNERRNANTWDYYAWRATTAKTPGVLIEHGVGPEADLNTAADADAAAILEYLNVTDQERQQLQGQIDNLNGIVKTLTEQRDYKDQLLGAANTRAGAAEEQVAQLRAQLAAAPAAPSVTVTSAALAVRVELSDGRAVEVPIP